MQASMTYHSSSTAVVSADAEALLATGAGPVAIVAGDSASVVTISVGSADASLITGSGAGAGATSLATGVGSGEICGASGASVGKISTGSAEASLMAGAGASGAAASVVTIDGVAVTRAAISAVRAKPSSMAAACGISARSNRLRSLARETAEALAPLFSMRAGAYADKESASQPARTAEGQETATRRDRRSFMIPASKRFC